MEAEKGQYKYFQLLITIHFRFLFFMKFGIVVSINQSEK